MIVLLFPFRLCIIPGKFFALVKAVELRTFKHCCSEEIRALIFDKYITAKNHCCTNEQLQPRTKYFSPFYAVHIQNKDTISSTLIVSCADSNSSEKTVKSTCKVAVGVLIHKACCVEQGYVVQLDKF